MYQYVKIVFIKHFRIIYLSFRNTMLIIYILIEFLKPMHIVYQFGHQKLCMTWSKETLFMLQLVLSKPINHGTASVWKIADLSYLFGRVLLKKRLSNLFISKFKHDEDKKKFNILCYITINGPNPKSFIDYSF